MTGAGASVRCRPVPAWRPPLNSDQLTAVLAKLHGWRPFDGGALLDDIGAVLDDVPPAENDLKAPAERLDRHLVQLVDIAVASQAGRWDESARALIGQGRALRAEVVPDGEVFADRTASGACRDRRRGECSLQRVDIGMAVGSGSPSAVSRRNSGVEPAILR